MPRTVVIIDARNYCARHAWTHKGLRAGKFPTGMMYGALSGLIRLGRIYPGAAFVFVWDGKNTNQSWRHKISKVYKSNRTHKTKETDPQKLEMWMQIPVLTNFLNELGFRQLEVETVEADDLIGILAFHVSTMVDRTVIYSMDKDFYQFIDSTVDVVPDLDKKKPCRPFSAKDVKKRFGVTPKQWLRYRALVGDKGDRIIGIPKVGPATALSLLAAGCDARKKTCEFDHKKADYIRSQWRQVRLNYRLSKIPRTVDTKIYDGKTTKAINALLKQIKCFEDLTRPEEKNTQEVYRWMLKWFTKYQMTDLFERRLDLWNLP